MSAAVAVFGIALLAALLYAVLEKQAPAYALLLSLGAGELHGLRIGILADLDGKFLTLLIHEHLDGSGVAQVDVGCAIELNLVAGHESGNGISAGGDQLHELKLFKNGHSNYSPFISMISMFSDAAAAWVVM